MIRLCYNIDIIVEFIEALYLGKQLAQTAIVDAVPGVFSTAFALIGSGDISLVIVGLLMIFGIGMALIR